MNVIDPALKGLFVMPVRSGDSTPTKWHPLLQTERLQLRVPRTSDHQSIFHNFSSDPEVTKYLQWRTHSSANEAYAFVLSARENWKGAANARDWVLVHRSFKEVIGALRLNSIGENRVSVGYVLSRYWWGQGIMFEAMTIALENASNINPKLSACALCDVENTRSQRLLYRLCFELNAVESRAIIHPNVSDQPRDCVLFVRSNSRDHGSYEAPCQR